ncbi:YopT-type cysteine protease domain-containing protein [Variovorax rhizosphaerae]|uniref:YopT-type cysteine protease domain-containing protein n=1 Tax=Variovorax rhizosphaerae TaxID=1836200 RepID=A0ABU8WJM2_9BURK
MPNYSLKTPAEIAALLAQHGATIGSFNQTKFQEELGVRGGNIVAGVGGQSLGSGYCAGVCLDWARRVLLSQPGRENFVTYGYDAMRAGRGTKDGRTLAESKERAYNSVARMGNAWIANNTLDWEGGAVSAVRPSSWAAKASQLEAQQPKGKSFTQLTMITSKMATYPPGDVWLSDLETTGLQPGAVTKFGFGRVAQSGHAVAVWQRKAVRTDADSFYLFDPNFGVFSCNADGLKAMFRILFYTSMSNTAYYSTCSSARAQEMSYIIFGPPNLVGAALAPGATAAQVPSTGAQAAGQPATGAAVNPYSPGRPALAVTPGRTASVAPSLSPADAARAALKAQLIKENDEANRQIPTFGNQRIRNGYVRISHSLKTKFEANPPTRSPVILTHGSEFAMAKDHMTQVIAML